MSHALIVSLSPSAESGTDHSPHRASVTQKQCTPLSATNPFMAQLPQEPVTVYRPPAKKHFPQSAVTGISCFTTHMVASTSYFKDKLVPRKLYRSTYQSLGTSAVRHTFETLSPRVGFLHRPDPSKEFCQKFPQLAAQYKRVKDYTCANHLGARITGHPRFIHPRVGKPTQ